MLKIAKSVKETIYSSEVALTSLKDGYLNLTAYAKIIRPNIEKLVKKSVKLGSIVISLSRLAKELASQEKTHDELIPKLILENIVVKSGLMEITLERTAQNNRLMQKIYSDQKIDTGDFFMISQGIGEITLIATEKNIKYLEKLFKKFKPKIVIKNLVAISITFCKKQLHLPNIIFALVRSLALKQINIIEIVSTRSELAFILDQQQLQTAFTVLNEIYQEGLKTNKQ